MVISIVALRWRVLTSRPARLFAAQTAFDLLIVTVGLWVVTTGLPALLFRSLYVLIITPVCLVTVPGGLATAGVASIAHLAGEYEAADSLAARAVAMDPICAYGWDRLGWVHEATNRPDDAMPFFARVQSIPAPYLDGAASLDGVGTAHFCAGRYQT
jgi:hypothetical protein